MSLSSTKFGSFRLFTIETGHFLLDGGAMFGVVPKTLWSRYFDSDKSNRILMTVRCLLIHSSRTGRVYLIDTGIGHKFDNKFIQIYGIDFSRYSLENSLSFHGFTMEDITDVIFTHMHFDHCGGSILPVGFQPRLAFPRAAHWVHKDQWNTVIHPNQREKSSFLAENINPLRSSGNLHFIDDHHIYEPGLSIIVVNGHTRGQQLPLIKGDNHSLLFAADLIPTAAHLPLSWVMAFDMEPLVTFKEKHHLLSALIRDKTYLYLQHDPHVELILAGNTPEKASAVWTGTLEDLHEQI